MATASRTIDEPGLRACASDRGLPLSAFPAEDRAPQTGIETPREREWAKVGIAAVAELAALLGSGADRWPVPKPTGPGITLALARRPVGDQANPLTYQP